jgi:hypothetical protein
MDQRYAVSTYCRILYPLQVASKRGALEWAPGSLETTYEFAAYAESFAL